MDLRPIQATATSDERAAVDLAIGDGVHGSGIREARGARHLILPALHAAQARSGWVSPGAPGYICERLQIPPAEGYGVASFYALFALSERAPVAAHVCDDVACKAKGADALCAELERTIGAPGTGKRTTWLRSPCLGMCEQAPAALIAAAGPA